MVFLGGWVFLMSGVPLCLVLLWGSSPPHMTYLSVTLIRSVPTEAFA